VPSVLIDARLILPKPTGIGQYLVSLVPPMLELAPDWTFHLLRRRDPWGDYGVADWRADNLVHHETDEPHMSLGQHLSLPRRARALRADILHYPHFDAPVLYAPVPVAATIHGTMHALRPRLLGDLSGPKRAYAQACYALTLRRAAAVLAVSATVAGEVRRLCGRRDGVHTTPLAADARFRAAPAAAVAALRERFALRRPYVLFVGEFRPHKNFLGLLDAWARTRHRESHDLLLAGLVHAGDPDPQDEIVRRGLAPGVRTLVDLPREDLVAAYTGAAVFVLPSLYEGFGLPVLEAMSCDVPVITSRTTATAEVAGDAALLVDPGRPDEIAAAIDRVLGTDGERARLVAAGRARRAGFTWRRTAELTLDAYRDVLARRDARRP